MPMKPPHPCRRRGCYRLPIPGSDYCAEHTQPASWGRPPVFLHQCATPGCSARVRRGHCPEHAAARERQRPNADVRLWYQTPRWRRLRLTVLNDEPICRDCQRERSTDVDHVVPHRNDAALFWDRDNLAGRCHGCHARKTRRGE